MATEAHCAYCFDSLASSLQRKAPLALTEIEASWSSYTQELFIAEELDSDNGASALESNEQARPAAISRLLSPRPASASSSVPSSAPSTPNPSTEASSTASTSSSSSSLLSFSRGSSKGDQQTVKEDFPLFVTWNIASRSGHKNLRGCIGTFEPQELAEGLRSYALTAAFDDTRFSPISSRELPDLECGVTLLTNFQPIRDPLAWEIGKHGLRISFTYHGRRYGSTYLPDVAQEQGWTKEETMVSLMRKAGWNGRKEDWRKVSDLNVITYQGDKAALDFDEYREWREWHDKQSN